MSKPEWDEYFVGMLEAVAKRASCDRGRSAAILTRNNRIISTGYVGAPEGLPECDDVGHDIERIYKTVQTENGPLTQMREHCVRTFHAEMNVILGCAKEGISTQGATLYCTMVPCRRCGMAIVRAGIVRVVATAPYHASEETEKMFDVAKIELVVLNSSALY